jgi:hypothetical protein
MAPTLTTMAPRGHERPWHGRSRTRLVARALLPPLSVYRSATAPKQADSVRAVWCSAPRALRKAAGDA